MYARTRMVFGNLPSPRHCVTKPQPAISIAVAKIRNKEQKAKEIMLNVFYFGILLLILQYANKIP
jgi:hypothetical protein